MSKSKITAFIKNVHLIKIFEFEGHITAFPIKMQKAAGECFPAAN